MRLVVFITLLVATVIALNPTASSAGDKAATDKSIMEACGGRLRKVFDQFGVPSDVYPSGSKKEYVKLDYGSYAFEVRDKTIYNCYFYTEWKGTIKGIKIGDDRANVVKVLGKEARSEKNNDGVDDLAWDAKELDAMFWVDFDKGNKVTQVSIELK